MLRRKLIIIDARKKASKKPRRARPTHRGNPDTDPDWTKNCETCGATPIVPVTGMCGPCTFGEVATMGGNW